MKCCEYGRSMLHLVGLLSILLVILATIKHSSLFPGIQMTKKKKGFMIFFSDLFCNPICWAVAYENVARIKMGDTERYLVQSFYKKITIIKY
jgi:hypothetical protein